MSFVRVGGNGTAPGSSLWVWCPGCDDSHRVTIGTESSWTWDGNKDAPTINPSIKVTGAQWDVKSSFYKPTHKGEEGDETICHSFLRAGVWDFLNDCTHKMVGQKVPMVPLPDWFDGWLGDG